MAKKKASGRVDEERSPRWHIGLPMSNEMAAELGRVVVLWSRLEHIMNGAICQLCGIGLNLGDVFLNNVNMPARHLILDGVATRYLKDKDPELCKELVKFSAKLREYKERNLVVHGLWNYWAYDLAATTHGSRRTHARQTRPWTLQDLKNVGDDISTFIMESIAYVELLDEMFPHPPDVHKPWRRKPPLRPARRSQNLFRRPSDHR